MLTLAPSDYLLLDGLNPSGATPIFHWFYAMRGALPIG